VRVFLSVLSKELRETLRDINTLVFSVLFPLFFYPFLVWMGAQADAYFEAQEQLRPIRVDGPPDLVAALGDDVIASTDRADATITQVGREIRVSYRSMSPRGARALQLVEDAFDPDVTIEMVDVAPKREQLLGVVAGGLPGLLVAMSLIASLYPAVEAVIAERERGTLETTLVTAAPRWMFFAGKLASVFTITLASLAANIGSILLTITHVLALLRVDMELPPARVLAIVPMAALAALAGAALALLAAVPTRTFKQAQNTTSAVSTFGMLLAGLGMMPRMDASGPLAYVPLSNAVLAMRESLLGNPAPIAATVAVVQLGAMAVGAIALGAYLASRESYR
jgi:ABC-type Na+ efflux pump permease subunit